MTAVKFNIPGEDAWLIYRLAKILAQRLVSGADETNIRVSLLRGLFALQRLPIMALGCSIYLGTDQLSIELNRDSCGLTTFTDDGHTVLSLKYFESSNHCLDGYEFLDGEEKYSRLESILDRFEIDFAEANILCIEDLSTGKYIDEPPIDDYFEYATSWMDS